jgi:hypothetical protein
MLTKFSEYIVENNISVKNIGNEYFDELSNMIDEFNTNGNDNVVWINK